MKTLRKNYIALIVVLLLYPFVAFSETGESRHSSSTSIPLGIIDRDLLKIGYSGQEKLIYNISWTGGIKLGELHLTITELPEIVDGYEISALVSTKSSIVHLIYPVEDLHVTKLRGPKRLPYHYEVWQKEGYNYRAHREVEYDQQRGFIQYIKNDLLEGEFQVGGETNNEFSSFFNSRLMDFAVGGKFVVPTFADKKRVEVVVHVISKKKFNNSILGAVTTVAVMPIMTFKGLYDKKGDTIIWYTDDECRVPVRIKSKIAIGSLTAELAGYSNPACKRYPEIKK